MKKVVLIVALLLLASQVMAATTITAVKNGSYTDSNGCRIQAVDIQYTSTVDIRGFALDVNITHGSLKNIRNFKVGESNSTSPGYGIFPSRFRDFISPTTPNWADGNYNPTPAWNEPGTTNPTTGMGFTAFTVEMGTLFAGDANKPALSGTLFTVDVNDETDCNAIALAIGANALRGGIVDANAAGVTGVVYNGLTTAIDAHCGPTTCTVSGRIVGAAAPRTGGIGGMTLNGLPGSPKTDAAGNYTATCNIGTAYTFNPVDGNNQWSWAPASVTITPSGNVVQNFTGTATECMNKLDTKYNRWVTYNKPDCWCFQKQCKGDADGLKTLTKPVASPDLTIFKAGVGQTSAYVKTLVVSGKPGICADFDRADTLSKPIASPDLTIFKSNVGVADTSVPQCPSATINAWKN